jgi:hypothetical protein
MRSGAAWLVWFFTAWMLGSVAFAAICSVSGCDHKQTPLDVKTPDKEVKVQRDRITGEVSVKVEKRQH